jgi:hypothetical protein
MTANQDKPLSSLGSDFEVIEDAAPVAAPAAAATAAPASGPSPYDPPFGPIRSANAWGSMGVVIAVAGLLGPWSDTGGNLVHGLLMAISVWFLIRGGFLAVQRTGATMPMMLPVAMIVYGGARLAISGELAAMGWMESGGIMGVSGALFTVIGGLVAVLMPRTVAKKKDAKLPPAGAPLQVDSQFSRSLLAYMMIFLGLQMSWTDQSSGVDSLGGIVTLLLAMLMVWASWVAMWQLWQKPLVIGKLGMLLFLTPMEALFMSIVGLVRTGMAVPEPGSDMEGSIGWIFNAYPASDGFEGGFLAYGGGPLMMMLASCYALYLIAVGAKEAGALVKQRKAQEIEARKSARSKKSDAKG